MLWALRKPLDKQARRQTIDKDLDMCVVHDEGTRLRSLIKTAQLLAGMTLYFTLLHRNRHWRAVKASHRDDQRHCITRRDAFGHVRVYLIEPGESAD